MNFAMDNKQYADAYLMKSCMNKQLGKKKNTWKKNVLVRYILSEYTAYAEMWSSTCRSKIFTFIAHLTNTKKRRDSVSMKKSH